jgi:hypothetical protein
MAGATIEELKKNRLAAMTADQRTVFDETYGAGHLALNVGEKVRGAREVAALSQEEPRRPDGHQPSRGGSPRGFP